MQRFKIHDISVKDVEPDSELQVWEDWVRVRTYETAKLAHKLIKPPVDLTMNLLVKAREEKEWKMTMENAQIPKKVGVRGTLWEQPIRLKQRCYCENVYEIQRTKAELGKPGTIEHVCVPKYIQQNELGMAGVSSRPKADNLDAEFMLYKRKREAVLAEKIKKIDPFRPKCDSLVVIGSKPKTPPKKIPPLPDIVITEPVSPPEYALCSVYAIRINNTVIFKDIPRQSLKSLEKLKEEKWHETCTSWSYYFNTPVKRAGRCKIFLENLGTVTLRYCWKKIKKPIPFIPEDIYEQVFFFNKNEDVLSPGQKKEIFFTFVSKKPGIYSEFWELSFCNICFFDSLANKFYVNLYADSVEKIDIIQRKIEILKGRIDKKAIRNIVVDIIQDAVTEATSIKPQLYPYKKLFLESELFIMKNPVCFYHQTEVNEMRKLYAELEPNKEWDLSIASWRKSMMSKKYEERMKYYQLLRKSHHTLLKPWYEGEDLATHKTRAVVFLLGQMADKLDREYVKILDIYCPSPGFNELATEQTSATVLTIDPLTRQKISNVFYVRAYDCVGDTIELIAGILSSLDLNRWIEFDFCQ